MALAVSTERKLFAGPRLRRVRAQLGLTQSRMAEELGVSVSYLNLIERNQRPLTAQFLLRLAEVFNLDLRQLTGDADDRTLADVGEVLTDGLFRNLEVSRNEVSDFV
ncbi:MAG TPA: helix-turn-helix transcriptional regulator, partial [Pedomonas sp.]|uniref:helix-turn-helix domain-containing protein n=1 Tax=Pedomonas sp. TaxID=2976421 RepID=UPI002F3F7E9A